MKSSSQSCNSVPNRAVSRSGIASEDDGAVTSCIITCHDSDQCTLSKVVNIPFPDGDIIDEPCPDSLFLSKLKERRGLLAHNSPKSNSSFKSATFSALSDPDIGLSQCSGTSRNYPLEAGLKWRQNRDRSCASAVSSLSSLSSDGMSTYRSTKEIQLSRKLHFTDISELRISATDERGEEDGEAARVLAALLTDKDADSPVAASPFPGLWTQERSLILSKAARLRRGSGAVLPLGENEEKQSESKTRTLSKYRLKDEKSKPEALEKSAATTKKASFSFKRLLPKFIRKRKFSLPFARRHSTQAVFDTGLGSEPPSDRTQTIEAERSDIHGELSFFRRSTM